MIVSVPSVLIDENIPRQLAPLLATAGISVVDAAQTVAGFSDEFLLDWASRENWMLVTGDLDFPRLIFAERRRPPLVLVVVFDGGDERVRAFPRGTG